VVDDHGDTVVLPRPATRVVSLSPATTELLFALGAGDRVVGRTHWCDYPVAALAVPDLGDGLTPNLEAVLGAHPDLVLLYPSARNLQAVERLHAIGIPTLQLATDRLRDVSRLARLLAPLVERAAAGDSLAARFERQLATVDLPRYRVPPRVFLLAWTDPPVTIGAGSFLDEIVTRAGAVNIFADLPAPSGPVSIEAVSQRDPDFILTTSTDLPGFMQRPEWQAVRAVRLRRLVSLPGSAFQRPSPRAAEAIARLAAALRQAGP
jgi:iron complex transport system substrate-binding protein